MKLVCILILALTSITTNNYEQSRDYNNITWGYNDRVEIVDEFEILSPDLWYQQYPDCSGSNQSPINIVESKTVYDTSLVPIKFNSKSSNYDSNSVWIRKNNGHTIQYSLSSDKIYTNFENEKFSLLQFHFHWGHSEHEINGELSKAELHLVHQSVSNSSVKAVLGFLFEVRELPYYM